MPRPAVCAGAGHVGLRRGEAVFQRGQTELFTQGAGRVAIAHDAVTLQNRHHLVNKAVKHELIENYRSKNNLVQFTNQFVRQMQNAVSAILRTGFEIISLKPGGPAYSLPMHEELCRAIENGDAEAAERAALLLISQAEEDLDGRLASDETSEEKSGYAKAAAVTN